MINYQGQMYGVVKTFGGGRRDRAEEEFFKAVAARKANKNINITMALLEKSFIIIIICYPSSINGVPLPIFTFTIDQSPIN